MDYSHHYTRNEKDLDPFIQKLGKKQYYAFLERTYSGLEKVETYDVRKVKPQYREMFIKSVCILILAFGLEMVFNEKFTELRTTKIKNKSNEKRSEI